ncbi:MAG: transglycosylase SLT domain-containing protein [Nitrososphaera sp.]
MAAGCLPSLCFSANYFPSKYDTDIKSAQKMYLPGLPWQFVKAQLYQESRLNPNAVSPAGARGIGQFMPGTWKEVSQRLGYGAIGPHEAGPAIHASAYYMATLRQAWRRLQDMERHKFALASYNAGRGNVSRARRLAGNSGRWDKTADQLHKVTGRYSRETVTYVRRVFQWYGMMQ